MKVNKKKNGKESKLKHEVAVMSSGFTVHGEGTYFALESAGARDEAQESGANRTKTTHIAHSTPDRRQ